MLLLTCRPHAAFKVAPAPLTNLALLMTELVTIPLALHLFVTPDTC
jgi:hypothetical protein